MTGNGPWGLPARVPVPFGHVLRPATVRDPAPPGPVGDGLAARVRAMADARSATYLLLDADETAVLGRVDLDRRGAGPPSVRWWVTEECEGTALAAALAELVPTWAAGLALGHGEC